MGGASPCTVQSTSRALRSTSAPFTPLPRSLARKASASATSCGVAAAAKSSGLRYERAASSRDAAEHQRVRDDAVGFVLARDRLHQHVHAGLRDAEQAAAGRGLLRRAGGDDDDAPARARAVAVRLREHRAQRRQREVVRGLDERGVVRAQVVQRRVDEPHDVPVAGEADDGVDAPEPLDARVDRRRGLRRIGEIGGERDRRGALGVVEQTVDRLARALGGARHDEHARAFAHQRRERRAADAPGRTGQDDGIPCEQHHRDATPGLRRFPGGGAKKHVAAWSFTTPTAWRNA